MKALGTAVLLVLAAPAMAQEAKPLPPDSFQWDGMNRLDLRSFEAPTPPTIIVPGPQGLMTLPTRPLPPESFRFDSRRNELRPFGAPHPEPKPEPKPERKIG